MSRPCPRILILDRLGPDLGSQVMFTALVELFGRAAEELGIDLALDESRLDELPLRPSTVETINESYDLVLVTGEDVLRHEAHVKTESGWALDVPASLLDAIEVPLAVLSAGYEAPAFTPDHLFEEAGDNLRAVRASAAMFTVRDPAASALFADRLGVEVDSTGPLAFAIEPADFRMEAIDPARRPIGVTLQLDAAQQVLPFPFQPRFETLIRTVVDSLECLVKEDGRQIVFVPHTLNEVDVELSRLLAVRLPEGSVVFAHEEVPGLYAPTEIHRAATLAAIYGSLDAVLGHRPASLTVPYAAGTPSVMFASTPGMRMLHESLCLPQHRMLDLRKFEREVRVSRVVSALRAAREPGAEVSMRRRVADVRRGLELRARRLVELAAARLAQRAEPPRKAASF